MADVTDLANPSNLAAVTGPVLDPGGSLTPKLLAPDQQAANVADVAGAAGANPTQAEYAVAVAAINSLKTAIVAAGLMKSA